MAMGLSVTVTAHRVVATRKVGGLGSDRTSAVMSGDRGGGLWSSLVSRTLHNSSFLCSHSSNFQPRNGAYNPPQTGLTDRTPTASDHTDHTHRFTRGHRSHIDHRHSPHTGLM